MLWYKVHCNLGSLSFWITNPFIIMQCSSSSQRQEGIFLTPAAIGCQCLLPPPPPQQFKLLFYPGDAGGKTRQSFKPFSHWLPFPSPSQYLQDAFPWLSSVLPSEVGGKASARISRISVTPTPLPQALYCHSPHWATANQFTSGFSWILFTGMSSCTGFRWGSAPVSPLITSLSLPWTELV